MKPPYFIKICGITNIDDALAAAEAGATAIGLNFYRESKRYIESAKAKEIADHVRGKAAVVGVFVNESIDAVKTIAASVRLTYCQFHGDESAVYIRAFPNAIKTFRVDDGLKNVYFEDYRCSAYLLDSYSDKEFGGTGKTFNWLLAREANEFGKIIVAGGLNAENVKQAIETAQPWGVDVSSGVERQPGIKDREKIVRFIHNATAAFEDLSA